MTDIFDFPGADKVEKPALVIEDEALAKGFTIIPNIVFKCRDLSAYAKLVYMALLSYAWQQDSCFPGQAHLADELQVSIDTIRRALRQLQERGLLRVTHRGQGKTNVYTLTKLS
jgi:DNA-binding MarR family transcriptional regulator